MSATPLIEILNATVWRGNTRVFTSLDLVIEQGCSTAVIGPNGAGKSTLIKLLSREVYPVVEEGSLLRILGEDRPVLWDLRQQIGLVSQDLQNQYRENVVGRDILLSGFHGSVGIYSHQQIGQEQYDRVDEIIAELGVGHLADTPYRAMSTGQQRRFLLGRALIHRPHSLVLDEPTSGLDLSATFQFLDLVREFIRGNGTVLLVTHHLHEIPPEVERVVLLADGAVVADGEPGTVVTSNQISEVFGTPVEILRANGFFQAVPRT